MADVVDLGPDGVVELRVIPTRAQQVRGSSDDLLGFEAGHRRERGIDENDAAYGVGDHDRLAAPLEHLGRVHARALRGPCRAVRRRAERVRRRGIAVVVREARHLVDDVAQELIVEAHAGARGVLVIHRRAQDAGRVLVGVPIERRHPQFAQFPGRRDHRVYGRIPGPASAAGRPDASRAKRRPSAARTDAANNRAPAAIREQYHSGRIGDDDAERQMVDDLPQTSIGTMLFSPHFPIRRGFRGSSIGMMVVVAHRLQ